MMATGKFSRAITAINALLDELVAARSGYSTLGAAIDAKVGADDFEGDQQRQETEIGAVAALGAKNLCPYNNFEATASGTVINDQPINLPAGTYILSFKYTASTGSTAFRFLQDGTSVEMFTVYNSEAGVEIRTFTLASDVNQIRLYTSIANAYTDFMIRRAEITDDTFAPYAPTNRELYEMILALQSGRSSQSALPSLMQAGRIDAELTGNTDGEASEILQAEGGTPDAAD